MEGNAFNSQLSIDEKTRSVLKGSLTTMWRNAITNRAVKPVPFPSRTIFRKDKLVVLTAEGLKAYDDFVEAVLTVPGVSAGTSKKRIEELTGDSILEVSDSPPSKIVSAVKEVVQRLEKRIRDPSVQWKVLFPISNLVMGLPELRLGRVRFLSGDN